MPSVIWLPDALADLGRIHRFLVGKNSEAAMRALDRIYEATQLLEHQPRMGRPLKSRRSLRELVVRFGSGAYLVRYQSRQNATILITRVRHSLQQHD